MTICTVPRTIQGIVYYGVVYQGYLLANYRMMGDANMFVSKLQALSIKNQTVQPWMYFHYE